MAQRKPNSRPKTGEARKTRQPLHIDRLPAEVHKAIELLRDPGGLSWDAVAKQSAKPYSKDWAKDGGGFVDWDSLETPVLELFPQCRLSSTSLHRWVDLRLEQVRAQVLKESAAARAFAEKFAGASIEGGNDAVMNAMRDEVFSLMRSVDGATREKYLEALGGLALAMTRIQRVDLQKKKVEAEIAKSEAQRAKIAASSGDPREVYLQAVQDLFKKLRTRSGVRAVLDPIREELIEEMKHGAESFAQQIEAAAA